SLFYVNEYVPNYFEMLATINAVKPTSGYNADAYLVFDYQTPTDFKFAGINVSTNKLEIGYRDATGWKVAVQKPFTSTLRSDIDYNLFLALNGTNVILTVNNQVTLTYTFEPRVDVYGVSHGLKDGMVGLGANNSKVNIDNVALQRVAPVMTVNKTVDFSSVTTDLFEAPLSGTWTLAAGRYAGTPGTEPAIDLMSVNVMSSSLVDLSATFNTTGEGGFIYDQYAGDDFKFVTISSGKIILGHRTPKGWFTDVVYTNASIAAGVDCTLGLTLKGTTVSVTLGDQAVGNHTYNALVTDGNFGLFSRSGATSFDMVTFKSDDPNIGNAAFLMAAAANQGDGSALALSSDALAPIVAEAINRWSLVVGAAGTAKLEDIEVIAADLPGGILGESLGATILIDLDAAGKGWFIDPTPADDAEFVNGATPAGTDLLTVVMHEMGHTLGLDDLQTTNEVMSATLAGGVRSTGIQPLSTAVNSSTPKVDSAPLAVRHSGGWVFGQNGESMQLGDFLTTARRVVAKTANQKPGLAIKQENTSPESSLVSLAGTNEGEHHTLSPIERTKPWQAEFLGVAESHPNAGIQAIL
ncbi:MAG: hypothetical protein M1608_04805, partial [Candidatus Omnitrophica bacterium]|nr:hypothetical protein [Candidatus Omnitrophota bacterium]